MAVQRIEVITGAGGRRSYSVEEKLRLVGEAEGGRGAVARVARRYGVCKTLIYRWRRQIKSGALSAEAAPSFVPVRVVAADPGADDASPIPRIGPPASAEPDPARPAPSEDRAATIEVVLPNGRVLRVAEDIAPASLRRLAGALDGR